jgi:hypothetical protein
MTRPALAGLVPLLTPRSARACATCIASPFGDPSYAWSYLGLILLPFGLLGVIAGLLLYLDWNAHLGTTGGPRIIGDPQIIKETT